FSKDSLYRVHLLMFYCHLGFLEHASGTPPDDGLGNARQREASLASHSRYLPMSRIYANSGIKVLSSLLELLPDPVYNDILSEEHHHHHEQIRFRPCGLYGKPSEDGLDLSTDVLVFLGPYVQLGYIGPSIENLHIAF
ncbi:hypothetical protein L9F63_005499, partial [Diploptera punctata]